MSAARPIDAVLGRLTIVHGAPPKMRAKCPVHGGKGGSLSVAEGRDGTVLLRCHAGCSAHEIVRAVGLSIGDLFSDSAARKKRPAGEAEERHRYLRDPANVIRVAIKRDIKQTRNRLRADLGYDRPLRSTDLNAIRTRVNQVYGTDLKPLPAIHWEGWAPHDTDPAWPTLYDRELSMVLLTEYGDPDVKPNQNDLYLAAICARRDLRDLAESECA